MADAPTTRVKFFGTYPPRVWLRPFPRGEPVWGRCTFTLDIDDPHYDWPVIDNDLPHNQARAMVALSRV